MPEDWRMSPVETLRAAAAKLRETPSEPWRRSGRAHPDIAVPLAGWLEREAFIAESVNGTQAAESADGYLSWPLAVARKLLGVSDDAR